MKGGNLLVRQEGGGGSAASQEVHVKTLNTKLSYANVYIWEAKVHSCTICRLVFIVLLLMKVRA